MPNYYFACTGCGKTFEAFRGFAQGTDGVVCPDDGAEALNIFSPAANPFTAGGRTLRDSSSEHDHAHAPGTPPHTH